jgi:hypothetical protein
MRLLPQVLDVGYAQFGNRRAGGGGEPGTDHGIADSGLAPQGCG